MRFRRSEAQRTRGSRCQQRHNSTSAWIRRQLVKRLDILNGLDQYQLDRVCRLLRPRFAVPNERIVHKGSGDAALLHRVRSRRSDPAGAGACGWGSGEFFGEMALLSRRPRQADVVALTYCQLLVLRRSDFERFMEENPEARATFNRIAEDRMAMNASERARSSDSPA